MKFELNEYHRNITDSELLEDVKRVANLLKAKSITIAEYDKYGKYNHTTFYKRICSWKKVLKLSGLGLDNHNFAISDEEYFYDIRRTAEVTNKKTITCTQYQNIGKYDYSKIINRFGSWDEALKQADLEPTGFHRVITDEDLFAEIERIWELKGSQPTTTDIKNNISIYSLNTFSRRFGGWRAALKAFIDYINCDDEKIVDDLSGKNENKILPYNKFEKQLEHKTQRDLNLRLRFSVLSRDNFKCCACGASPAKDPSVDLHIDHIIPWAKGGETVVDNLQTLCSKCNLGKSDIL